MKDTYHGSVKRMDKKTKDAHWITCINWRGVFKYLDSEFVCMPVQNQGSNKKKKKFILQYHMLCVFVCRYTAIFCLSKVFHRIDNILGGWKNRLISHNIMS